MPENVVFALCLMFLGTRGLNNVDPNTLLHRTACVARCYSVLPEYVWMRFVSVSKQESPQTNQKTREHSISNT